MALTNLEQELTYDMDTMHTLTRSANCVVCYKEMVPRQEFWYDGWIRTWRYDRGIGEYIGRRPWDGDNSEAQAEAKITIVADGTA